MANWYLTTLWLLMHLIKLAAPSLLEQRNPGHNNKAISSPCTGLRPFLLYIENQVYSVLQCERKYRIKPTENLSQVPGTLKSEKSLSQLGMCCWSPSAPPFCAAGRNSALSAAPEFREGGLKGQNKTQGTATLSPLDLWVSFPHS